MEFMESIKRPVVEGVHFIQTGSEPIEGILCISAFHCIFSTRSTAATEIMFLHSSILSLERKPQGGTTLEVILKDFRHFSLEFKNPEECGDVVESLEMLSHPTRMEMLHSFFSRPRANSSDTPPLHLEGYASVFKRCRCPPEKWKLSSCNKNYILCLSYPEEVIVPSKMTDKEIGIVAGFRQHGRFPILCYYDNNTKACLMKCGQPLCGSSQKRCKEDIASLNACLQSVGKGRILDVRTQQKAQHQTSKGGGVEFPSNYSQWRVEYASLESLSHLSSSYSKLVEACIDSSLHTSSSWFGKVEASGWLSHVERLLKAVKHVVHSINSEGSSVVVHGTTGRDATLQVISLALLLMDPYCRTIKGFIEMIQREWLDGGHPFSLRHGHTTNAPDKERGPVFLIFLDAVWQVMQQYPLSFEFDERLPHCIFVHSYSSSYGTFLYDTPAERVRVKVTEKTQSLWDYLLGPTVLSDLRNPLYERNNGVLTISTHPCSIGFWKNLYFRQDMNNSITIPERNGLLYLKTKNSALKLELEEMRRQVDVLQGEGRQYSNVWR